MDQIQISELPLLVFVNPASGKGHALREWQKAIPIFEKYQVKYEVIMTTHQNHCQEILSSIDLKPYKGIILVSGDGLPHEAINALFSRQDREQINHISIGVLPGGSGNALAKTITNISNLACNSESCALIIAKGQTKKMDLMEFQMENQKIVSFLSLAYAFISEVDLGSESMRFLGGARFDVYGTWRALFQKKYHIILNGKQINIKYFLVQKIPYISDNFLSGPAAQIDDGFMDLQYLESQDWTSLIKLSLNQYSGKHVTVNEDGTIQCHGNWKYEKIKEFTLEPITNCPYSIDGERYQCKPVKGIVLPKALNIFCL